MKIHKKIRSKFNAIRKKLSKMRSGRLLLVLSFVLVGVILIVVTKAATPTASLEAENGQSTNTTRITDGGASGGSAIGFGKITPSFKRFFSDNASWNKPVSSFGRATNPNLTKYKDIFWLYAGAPAAPGAFNVQFKDFTIPMYDVKNATTTARVFQDVDYQGWALNNAKIGDNVPWNPSWKAGTGEDGILSIVDYDSGRTWGFWRFGTTGPWKCLDVFGPNTQAGFNIFDPLHLCLGAFGSGDGLYTGDDNSIMVERGAGLSKMALTTRVDEVLTGSINHALEMTIPGTMFGIPECSPINSADAPGAGTSCGIYLPPATRVEWRSNENNATTNRCPSNPISVSNAGRAKTVPEGIRMAIDVTEGDITNWLATKTSWSAAKKNTARIFARAFRDYGAVVGETGCWGIGIETEGIVDPIAAAKWDQVGITADGGSSNPHGDLLNGLITQQNLYVVNPPAGR